jgi:hypothetical protein
MVKYEEEAIEHGGGDRGFSVADVWRNIRLSRAAPITVMIAGERTPDLLGDTAGSPVLATIDARAFEVVRNLCEEASRLERSPDLIREDVSSLSRRPNPALAGYLFTRLAFPGIAIPPDVSASLLSSMMGNPGVPIERWDRIPGPLLWVSLPLGVPGRVAAIRRFAELAQSSDKGAALTGLNGIAIATSGGDEKVGASIPNESIAAIRGRYAELVQGRRLARNRRVEAVLGLTDCCGAR